jgi:dUTP pyrophosphatase|tara:strand:+ start:834 stop:1277 length:444 start_codon:yes stop_codon:yes gene_type:complete
MRRIELKVTHTNGVYPRPPEYATVGSAGLDLVSLEEKTLLPKESHKFDIGLAIYMGDTEICGLICPRSGLASKGISLKNTLGIIDSDYQGSLIVNLVNFSEEEYTVEQGDRIAQLVIMPIHNIMWTPVLEFSGVTKRSIGGFGSTGE